MQGITARVKYRKTGLIRFVGHLDTIRALLRAVRRAGIEGVYSRGFSPRLRLSFGRPLPLGCTSDCEFFDIKLARRCQADSIKHSLQSHLPEGLSVEEVRIVQGNSAPPATAFWAAEYEVEVPHECRINGDDLERICSDSALPAEGSDKPGERGGSLTSRLVRARWHDGNGGRQVLSVVLREEPSGKGGLKETLRSILGIPRETLEKCKIHKKRVFSRRERGTSGFS